MSTKSTTKAFAAKRKATPAKKAPPEYLGGAARLIQLVIDQPRSKWTRNRAEIVLVLIAQAQNRQQRMKRRLAADA
jgi:hypothetical protein